MQELSPGLETSDCRHLERAGLAAASLSRKTLAPLGSAPSEHLAAALGRHPRAEAVPPLADEPRWLKGALHGEISASSGVRALIGGTITQVNRSQSGLSQAVRGYQIGERGRFGRGAPKSKKSIWRHLSLTRTEARLAG
jgi:hypothetical protein